MAHFHRDYGGVFRDFAGDDAAKGFDGEGFRAHFALVSQVAGEDAQTVTALFSFAAVWIQDAQTELGFVGGEGTMQDTIGTKTKIAMADTDDFVFQKGLGAFAWIENEVVVSEGVELFEFHVNKFRPPGCVRRPSR